MKKYLLLPLSALLVFASCKNKSQVQEAELRDVEESQKDLVEQMEKSLNSEEGLEVDPEFLEQHHAKVNSAADKMGGKLGEAMKAVAALDKDAPEMTRRLNEAAVEIQVMVDWSTLQEQGNFDERRQFFADYKKFNQELIELYENRPADVKRVLNKIGFKGQDRRDFETGLFSKLNPQIVQIKVIRECDIEICDSATRVLDFFEKLGDSWTWDSEQGGPIFETDEDVATFNKEMEIFISAGNRQMQAQEKVVELMKG